MKYKLILLSILVIMFVVIFIMQRPDKKDNISNMVVSQEITNIADLIKQLTPLVSEVSGKNFSNDNLLLNEYTFNMIDILSEQVIDNITDIQEFKNYNMEVDSTFRFGIKMEILSLITQFMEPLVLITQANEDNNQLYDEFTDFFISYMKQYIIPLKSLYDNNIDINNYVAEYKEPYCSYEQYMQEYKRQLAFLNNIQTIIETLNLSTEDSEILNSLMEQSDNSHISYVINSALYDNIEPYNKWEIYKNKYIVNDEQKTYLNNIYKYKAVKSLKNISLIKIYMQFLIFDDKYANSLSNISQMEQEYPEEFYEESTLFVSGCTNPQYLLENTKNKCIEFIKNAATNEDAFAYLEDENIAGYVMIDNKLCATKKADNYIFYNNDNIMCQTLKEKLAN